jgi:hypothetical protein
LQRAIVCGQRRSEFLLRGEDGGSTTRLDVVSHRAFEDLRSQNGRKRRKRRRKSKKKRRHQVREGGGSRNHFFFDSVVPPVFPLRRVRRRQRELPLPLRRVEAVAVLLRRRFFLDCVVRCPALERTAVVDQRGSCGASLPLCTSNLARSRPKSSRPFFPLQTTTPRSLSFCSFLPTQLPPFSFSLTLVTSQHTGNSHHAHFRPPLPHRWFRCPRQCGQRRPQQPPPHL